MNFIKVKLPDKYSSSWTGSSLHNIMQNQVLEQCLLQFSISKTVEPKIILYLKTMVIIMLLLYLNITEKRQA